MRLARYIAHAGVASRRAAEELIRTGRVTVDGARVLDPATDVADSQSVTVDGARLDGPEARVVFAVHKPLGVVSTARDTHGRPTVVALVPAQGRRLYPVGRLDTDTSGLILLTNDGDLAHRLTHPRFEVPKTYHAVVGGPPLRDPVLAALRRGGTAGSRRPRSTACVTPADQPRLPPPGSDTIAPHAALRPARRHIRAAQRQQGHPRGHHRADDCAGGA